MPIALDIRLDIAIGRTRTYDNWDIPELSQLDWGCLWSGPHRHCQKYLYFKIHVMKFYSSHQLPVPAEDGIYHQSFILHQNNHFFWEK